jgi:hypothetical protein
MALLDATVVTVALLGIGEDLDADGARVHEILNG